MPSRSETIRHIATLPIGSPERRRLLASLKTAAFSKKEDIVRYLVKKIEAMGLEAESYGSQVHVYLDCGAVTSMVLSPFSQKYGNYGNTRFIIETINTSGRRAEVFAAPWEEGDEDVTGNLTNGVPFNKAHQKGINTTLAFALRWIQRYAGRCAVK